MKRLLISSFAAGTFATVILSNPANAKTANAQTKPASKTSSGKATPRTADSKPDLSGF